MTGGLQRPLFDDSKCGADASEAFRLARSTASCSGSRISPGGVGGGDDQNGRLDQDPPQLGRLRARHIRQVGAADRMAARAGRPPPPADARGGTGATGRELDGQRHPWAREVEGPRQVVPGPPPGLHRCGGAARARSAPQAARPHSRRRRLAGTPPRFKIAAVSPAPLCPRASRLSTRGPSRRHAGRHRRSSPQSGFTRSSGGEQIDHIGETAPRCPQPPPQPACPRVPQGMGTTSGSLTVRHRR